MKTATEWIRKTSPFEVVEVDKINWGDNDYELTADWRNPEIANFILAIQRDAIKAAAKEAEFESSLQGCDWTLCVKGEDIIKQILKLLPPEE